MALMMCNVAAQKVHLRSISAECGSAVPTATVLQTCKYCLLSILPKLAALFPYYFHCINTGLPESPLFLFHLKFIRYS